MSSGEKFREKIIIKTRLNMDYINDDYRSDIMPEIQQDLHITAIANSLLEESNNLGFELSRILELINKRIDEVKKRITDPKNDLNEQSHTREQDNSQNSNLENVIIDLEKQKKVIEERIKQTNANSLQTLSLINLAIKEQKDLTSIDIRIESNEKEFLGSQDIGEVSEIMQNSDVPILDPELKQIKADISYYISYIRNYKKVLVKTNEDLKMWYTILEMEESYIQFCKNMIQEIEEEQKMKSEYYSIEELKAFKREYMSDIEQIEIKMITIREKIKKMEKLKKILEANLSSVGEKLKNAELKDVMISSKKERRRKIKNWKSLNRNVFYAKNYSFYRKRVNDGTKSFRYNKTI